MPYTFIIRKFIGPEHQKKVYIQKNRMIIGLIKYTLASTVMMDWIQKRFLEPVPRNVINQILLTIRNWNIEINSLAF